MTLKYEGTERRGTIREETTITDEEALGALGRAIKQAPFTEGDAMRTLLQQMVASCLSTREGDKKRPASPGIIIRRTNLNRQARKYVENLVCNTKHGHGLALKEITDGGLYNPEEEGVIKAPTIEEAIEILQKKLSTKEVEAIQKYIKIPGLAIEPCGLPWRNFIDNLEMGTSDRFRIHVTKGRCTEFNRQDAARGIQREGRITGYRVGMVERKREPKSHTGYIGTIIEKWLASQAAEYLQLPTHKLIALIQKGALLSGDRTQLDKFGSSILKLDAKPKKGQMQIVGPDGVISISSNSDCDDFDSTHVVGQTCFRGKDPRSYYRGLRLRPTLMKDA